MCVRGRARVWMRKFCVTVFILSKKRKVIIVAWASSFVKKICRYILKETAVLNIFWECGVAYNIDLVLGLKISTQWYPYKFYNSNWKELINYNSTKEMEKKKIYNILAARFFVKCVILAWLYYSFNRFANK